jgi:hypothetical protein
MKHVTRSPRRIGWRLPCCAATLGCGKASDETSQADVRRHRKTRAQAVWHRRLRATMKCSPSPMHARQRARMKKARVEAGDALAGHHRRTTAFDAQFTA